MKIKIPITDADYEQAKNLALRIADRRREIEENQVEEIIVA